MLGNVPRKNKFWPRPSHTVQRSLNFSQNIETRRFDMNQKPFSVSQINRCIKKKKKENSITKNFDTISSIW